MKHGVVSLFCAWNITSVEINSGVQFFCRFVEKSFRYLRAKN